ncbi:MAG TPA: biotin/lipoyl-containing protein [Pyrinomonadaceae bacterium]
MKLIVEIDGDKRELEIKRDGSHVVAEVDSRRYEIEAHSSQEGVYLLLNEGRVYQCRVSGQGARREAFDVTVGSRAFQATLTDPKRLRAGQSMGAKMDGTAQILAPMPGKVVRVMVETGAEVEEGTGLVVVEAMKMQNEMKSPKTGKVTTINVTAGATVNTGDVLAIVE